ncbi:MAG: type II secretion system F family protein [Candidatus Altiarchaeota archaeon]|nr:type II secretion system F family protein [Candidatus Altiarchaeota archaeon]
MASTFESEKLKTTSKPFIGIAQKLERVVPGLEWDLEKAGIHVDPLTYISITVYLAFSVGMATFAGILLPAYMVDKLDIGMPMALGAAIGLSVFMLFYMLLMPKVKIRKRAGSIEKNLGYALKDLEIQTGAGIPVFDAMVHVANGGYGECSEEFKQVIKKVESGRSVVRSLDEVGMQTASPFLRRIIWQIVNSMYAGSDVSIALKAISSDLTREKETRIKAYGQEMNLWSLMYMLMVIVLPSQGITLLIILSTLIDIFGKIDKNLVFGGIVVFMFFFQFMLVGFIKNKRPVV